MRYWYWAILGCFRTIGIVKGFSKYCYWYWALLRAFQSIGLGIEYCYGLFRILVLVLSRAFQILVLGIVKGLSKYWNWYWVLLRPFQNFGIGIGYC